jgi:hypothetical protein
MPTHERRRLYHRQESVCHEGRSDETATHARGTGAQPPPSRGSSVLAGSSGSADPGACGVALSPSAVVSGRWPDVPVDGGRSAYPLERPTVQSRLPSILPSVRPPVPVDAEGRVPEAVIVVFAEPSRRGESAVRVLEYVRSERLDDVIDAVAGGSGPKMAETAPKRTPKTAGSDDASTRRPSAPVEWTQACGTEILTTGVMHGPPGGLSSGAAGSPGVNGRAATGGATLAPASPTLAPARLRDDRRAPPLVGRPGPAEPAAPAPK